MGKRSLKGALVLESDGRNQGPSFSSVLCRTWTLSQVDTRFLRLETQNTSLYTLFDLERRDTD
ncbi:hypothetical protein PISMIDRAFT_403243 [Pisolithus microcarpus 441]|uniref:Uncharacterized protein n=1 Tax=Pisolithus microcarpus 441 TaxID=765257 RepID=A0A0C9Z601_9AGAM|nr:hypothetical protein PISMIDRAFT_403243 [Pisolithus microcarpus 441]